MERSSRIRDLLLLFHLTCTSYFLALIAVWPAANAQTTGLNEWFPRWIPWLACGVSLVALFSTRRLAPRLSLGVAALSLSTAIFSTAAYPRTTHITARPVFKTLPVPYSAFSTGPGRQTELSSYEDSRTGFRMTPGSRWLDYCEGEFNVKGVFDEEGWRRVPDTRPRILVLGCSFTLGVGVNDDETYAFHLSQAFQNRFRMVIGANTGWGTTHAAVVCEDELKKPNRIAAVLYGFIAHHAVRNYLSRTWHRDFDGGFPFFELEHNALVYRGLRPHKSCQAEDDEQTRDMQTRITEALISHIDSLCRVRNVPFFVVGLPEKRFEPTEVICQWLPTTNIGFIDLRQVIENPNSSFYPRDGHPMPPWHSQVGVALAAHEKLGFLQRVQ